MGFHAARDKEGEGEVMTKQKTGPLLTLDMVAGTKEAKFRLKYVIQTFDFGLT